MSYAVTPPAGKTTADLAQIFRSTGVSAYSLSAQAHGESTVRHLTGQQKSALQDKGCGVFENLPGNIPARLKMYLY